jgi:hypothetical protein
MQIRGWRRGDVHHITREPVDKMPTLDAVETRNQDTMHDARRDATQPSATINTAQNEAVKNQQ